MRRRLNMPFTISHIAAVLPLRLWCTRSGQFSALAIGAMMPDMPYFITPFSWGVRVHTVHSLFWWSAPLGALIWWLWHRAAKHAFAACLTPMTRCQLALCGHLCPPEISVYRATLLSGCGAATHLVWDSFTHFDGLGVRSFSILNSPLLAFRGKELPVYFVLQILFSVIGLIAVSGAVAKPFSVRWWHLPDWFALVSPQALTAGLVLCAVPCVAVALVLLSISEHLPRYSPLALALLAFCAAVAATIIVAGVYVAIYARLRASSTNSGSG
jgi:hypothetical protein